jgi:hypothetical protein
MYGTDLSDEEHAENMNQMFVNLPAEVITQGVSMIHADFTKFFRAAAEYYNDEPIEHGGSLAKMRGIQQCFIIIQNRCVRATDASGTPTRHIPCIYHVYSKRRYIPCISQYIQWISKIYYHAFMGNSML